MREYISGAEFRDMLLCASAALEADKQKINELNVFPVPDGASIINIAPRRTFFNVSIISVIFFLLQNKRSYNITYK